MPEPKPSEVAVVSASHGAQPGSGVQWVQVEVAFGAEPRLVQLQTLRLPANACTVQHALDACGLQALQTALQQGGSKALSLGVAGVAVKADAQLMDGDRLDCCRALRVDPKLARRERFNQQGVRRSGLFAKRRPGAVAGY